MNYVLPASKGHGYFWTVPDNSLYHLHLLLEMILVSLTSLSACAVDSAYGFYIYQFASTLRAMTYRLMNPLPTEKFSDTLRMCLMKHQKLLQCRDILERVYGAIILWYIITNTVILCSLIYELSDFKIKNMLMFLTWALVKLFQMFIYSWYGSVLTNASEDFRNGIYFGKWYNSNLDCHVRTNVILMLMQKPMVINALFIPIDATVFKSFVNTTASYFFLLQSIGDKDK